MTPSGAPRAGAPLPARSRVPRGRRVAPEGPSQDEDQDLTRSDPRPRVALLGAGTIARTVIDAIRKADAADIVAVLVRDLGKARAQGPDLPLTDDPEQVLSAGADLVIEAATPDAVRALAVPVLERSDFCAFSLTTLADAGFAAEVEAAGAASGRRFHAPHGAVLALDGLADGRDALERVTVTTTKSARSFGLPEDAEGLVFEGSARDACLRFPRNVNVHAAVAIAGLGFDRTVSRIIVAPQSPRMAHHIEAEGPGLAWSIEVASQSLGGVTGSYTPVSAAGSVLRLLGASPAVRIA